jgi:REP element-mobilizing transposase RayT
MPNHFHGLIHIVSEKNFNRPRIQETLPAVVRSFKSFSSRFVNTIRRTPGAPVWHKSYYDRIIRNQTELKRHRKYIEENPENWHPSSTKS